MRTLWTAAAWVAVLGITGLFAGCKSGGGGNNLFNPAVSIFSNSATDANSDGRPEFSLGITVYTDPVISEGCDTTPVEVVSATLSFVPEVGTMDGGTFEDTGPSALCTIDAHQDVWRVPTDTPVGIYSITLQLELRFADGSSSTDEISYEAEVVD